VQKVVAFYAWQSDRPEEFHRHFIRIALDEAAARINADASVEAELFVDSDTQGALGTPPVSDTILKKINRCDIFIPDLTFVAAIVNPISGKTKLIPNPNVMVEYGYALKVKTHAGLMPVMNTTHGAPEELPFDI
jgi:hypothetical protein